MFNEISLIGRVGKDPELRQTQSGTPVCNFSLATSETTIQNGVKVEKTEWHQITCWQKTAENAAKYVRKGSLVFVKGKLQYEKYVDKEGNNREWAKIVCFTLKFLTPAKVQSSQQDYDFGGFPPPDAAEPKQEQHRASPAWDDDDTIPF